MRSILILIIVMTTGVQILFATEKGEEAELVTIQEFYVAALNRNATYFKNIQNIARSNFVPDYYDYILKPEPDSVPEGFDDASWSLILNDLLYEAVTANNSTIIQRIYEVSGQHITDHTWHYLLYHAIQQGNPGPLLQVLFMSPLSEDRIQRVFADLDGFWLKDHLHFKPDMLPHNSADLEANYIIGSLYVKLSSDGGDIGVYRQRLMEISKQNYGLYLFNIPLRNGKVIDLDVLRELVEESVLSRIEPPMIK